METAQLGVLCPALTGWDTGTAAPLPATPTTALAGLTTWIPTTGSVAAADLAQRRFSVFGLRTDATGQRGRVVTVRPDNPTEMIAVAQAQATVTMRFRMNDPAPIPLSAGLLAFANSQAAGAEYPIARTASGWQLTGGSFADIRRVGNRWVVVEVPRNAPAGLYFNVFGDAPLAAQ